MKWYYIDSSDWLKIMNCWLLQQYTLIAIIPNERIQINMPMYYIVEFI